MNIALSDLRHAVRNLAAHPTLAAIAIASLALGIGANTAIFSVVDAVLLRSLPFPGADRIVALEERDRDGTGSNTSFATFADWRSRSRSFSGIAATSYWSPKLSGQGPVEAEKLEGLRVSDGFFRALGVRPMLGRDFFASEDRQGAPRVAILSYGLWTRRFGGDRSIVGRTIRISDVAFEIVGVLPRGFESVFSPPTYKPAEIWSPLRYDASLPYACRTCRHLRAFGRLQDGVSIPAARAELDSIERNLWTEHPADYNGAGTNVVPLSQKISESVRPTLWALLGAVGFVLLIACANVASLLLAKSAGRRREVGIRVALGAGRARIARLFLTEALVIAATGGVLGLAFAAWLLEALLRAAPVALPRLSEIRVDLPVLGFTGAVSLVTGLVFGMVPAIRMSREDPQGALRDGGGSGRDRSVASMAALIAFDAAVAFVLVFGAGLLVRSTRRLLEVRPGFSPAQVVKLEVDLSGPRYQSDESVAAYFDTALFRVRSLPGVSAAGVVSQLPLGGDSDSNGIHVAGKDPANPSDAPTALRYGASAGYLEAMGIPVRRGRGFRDSDRLTSEPVALVNETFARIEWPGEDPIGKRLTLGDKPARTVVGIVGDVHHQGLDTEGGNQVYVPSSQWGDSSVVFVVRGGVGKDDTRVLAAAVRAAIRSVDPDQPISRVATLETVLEDSAGTRRFAMDLLSGFAILATLLAAAGIYGVVSGSVTRRTREIGIRVALGAPRRSILSLVAGRATLLTAAGIGAGVLAALGLARGLGGLLFGVAPTDPASLAASALIVLSVAALASLVPAWRAARLDPLVALREE